MKNILKKLQFLLSPFFIGLTATLFSSFFCFKYFAFNFHDQAAVENDIPSIYKFIHNLNLEFFDQRLRLRGPRQDVSPNVALLAIDEKSLEAAGRWPWPRDIMAQASKQAIDYGAKVISYDIVFAEDTALPSVKILTESEKLSPEEKQKLEQEIYLKNPDNIFANMIFNNAKHIVLGSYMTGENQRLTYHDACFNMIFEQTPAYEVWENEESYMVVIDSNPVEFPDSLKDLYLQHLELVENQVIEENQGAPPSTSKHLAKQAKLNYCYNWLSEFDDFSNSIRDNWDAVVEQSDDDLPASFDEWADNFIYGWIGNPINLTLDWTMNIDSLNKAKKHNGFFNAVLDTDGSIRTSRLVVRSGETYMPSISLKGYLQAYGYNANIELEEDPDFISSSQRRNKIKRLYISDSEGNFVKEIPVDKEGKLFINYAGKQKTFPHISYSELLNDSEDITYFQAKIDDQGNLIDKDDDGSADAYTVKKSEFLKDKILLAGATAIGIYDLRVTPFEANYPGAETHVTVIDNLINNNAFRPLPNQRAILPVVVLLLGLILSVVFTYLGAFYSFLITIATVTVTYYIDRYYYFNNGIIVTVLFPLGTILFIYVAITIYKYFTEERNKRELKGTFAKYVSPAIVDEVLADPDNIELGGKKLRMSVFFSDIRGFTTISEKLDPRQLSDLLNSYLTPMTDIVFKNKGTLDKYMGDAVMAFFGAPIQYPDHAAYACRCALDQLVKLKELQKQYEEQGLPHIDIGIGVNTGDMSVGNMGSQTVRSYTVMGDAVNLGSRLEGINKQYGTRIIISEFTYEDVKDNFVCREIDWVRVKGKLEPVRIFELCGENKVDDSMQTVLNHFNLGFKLYHEMQWQKAIEEFEKAIEIHPEDGPSKLYLDRCSDYLQEPPEENWDGVFVMKTK